MIVAWDRREASAGDFLQAGAGTQDPEKGRCVSHVHFTGDARQSIDLNSLNHIDSKDTGQTKAANSEPRQHL